MRRYLEATLGGGKKVTKAVRERSLGKAILGRIDQDNHAD
jgi:hypothetical protein